MVQDSHAQVVISVVSWSKFLGRMGKSVPSLFSAIASTEQKSKAKSGGGGKKAKSAAGSAEAAALIKRLQSVPEAKRLSVLSGTIQQKVMEVLGVTDASAVGQQQALSEVGMDSLMAVEVTLLTEG